MGFHGLVVTGADFVDRSNWSEKRYFLILCMIIAVSALVNVIYGQILNDTLDPGKFKWLIDESRQASNAAGEFVGAVIVGILKVIAAVLLLVGARRLLRAAFLTEAAIKTSSGKLVSTCLAALAIIPSIALAPLGLGPMAAERNSYNLLYAVVSADDLPPKEKVDIPLVGAPEVSKIIWLIDESISHEVYSTVIEPDIRGLGGQDFGPALSLSSCSGPSNFALRSGVRVRTARDTSDLRKMPSIWAYAKKAGYQTILIDGQVSGPPQNILLDSESALIDRYQSATGGLKTDQKIARDLNNQLNSNKKQFIYVVLKGVHFQYRDHYPAGTLDESSSTEDQYLAAVRYSKSGFFEALLSGGDRSDVAIFYTSDHGQNIQPGRTPHCTPDPPQSEFVVPMAVFAPKSLPVTKAGTRSASQIFPTTLALMGFDRKAANSLYDNGLARPSAKALWFGRNVIPLKQGDKIELHAHRNLAD